MVLSYNRRERGKNKQVVEFFFHLFVTERYRLETC